MKRAFTLVELMIVVAILGILAAIVLPEFTTQTQQAKEAAAKANLRILREAIERYAVKNNGIPPGYSGNDTSTMPLPGAFIYKMKNESYLSDIPENPFNNLKTLLVIPDAGTFPADAADEYGWIYKPQTKTIKLDWPGTDSKGVLYFDY